MECFEAIVNRFQWLTNAVKVFVLGVCVSPGYSCVVFSTVGMYLIHVFSISCFYVDYDQSLLILFLLILSQLSFRQFSYIRIPIFPIAVIMKNQQIAILIQLGLWSLQTWTATIKKPIGNYLTKQATNNYLRKQHCNINNRMFQKQKVISQKNSISKPRPPKFYITPKIHKSNNPGSPMKNSIECHTTEIWRFVDPHIIVVVK